MSITADSRFAEIRERKSQNRKLHTQALAAVEAARSAEDVHAQAVAELKVAQVGRAIEVDSELENLLLRQVAGVSGATGFVGGLAFDAPAVVAELEQIAHSEARVGRLDLGPINTAEQVSAMINTGDWGPGRMAAATAPTLPDQARYGEFLGIRQTPRRRLRLLDLIPSQTMNGASFYYAQELGALDDAAETAETSLKPQGDDELEEAQVIAKTIAVWNTVARQQFSDLASFGTWLQNRLSYKVLRRLEGQIVGGDGTGSNILGIIHQSGIGTAASGTGDQDLDQILEASGVVLAAEADPDAAVVNPLDLVTMRKLKSSGSGEYFQSPWGSLPATLWDLPVIPSTLMPRGHALVGAFAEGATVYVREGVNVRLSDSDQDNFVKNKLTCLAEGRFGLAVWQPGAFVYVTLIS